MTALSLANVCVGLKNSDDTGTYFDPKAEVYEDTTLIGSGQVSGKVGGSSGFNNAELDSIPLTLLAPIDVPPGTALSVTLSARITCSHDSHASGTARLWFNDAQAKSRFGATINGATNDYYLSNGSALGTTQGSGPKRTTDIGVDKRVACPVRPFTSFGTWSTTPTVGPNPHAVQIPERRG